MAGTAELLETLLELPRPERARLAHWLIESLELTVDSSNAAAGGSDPGLSQFADAADSDEFWNVEYRQQLVARALEIMQAEFEPSTWQACWQTTVEDRPAADVAAELGITINAVYVARSRVLRRLREELRDLLDE